MVLGPGFFAAVTCGAWSVVVSPSASPRASPSGSPHGARTWGSPLSEGPPADGAVHVAGHDPPDRVPPTAPTASRALRALLDEEHLADYADIIVTASGATQVSDLAILSYTDIARLVRRLELRIVQERHL
jgi:hypothetical protein